MVLVQTVHLVLIASRIHITHLTALKIIIFILLHLPSESTVSVSFDYGYDDYNGSDSFYVYLFNATSGSSSTLLSLTTDAENQSYSENAINVSAGNSYRLLFRYRGTYVRTTVDNILVTNLSGPSISVGSAITGLDYVIGSGPSTSQTTAVSGANLEADITVDAPQF